ncbi:hypothetical protein KNCP2_08330 [Candidatus Rickettsia kedanie]|uniref:Uncharacterized protein n=1 Tax=Candidatus Rickettsia kedanie TaxID=3115352 RepID=A0ABP9TZH4_9RICK
MKFMHLLKNITGKNYINGEFVEFGKQISVINPSTLKAIATVPNLELSEINSAIIRCKLLLHGHKVRLKKE